MKNLLLFLTISLLALSIINAQSTDQTITILEDYDLIEWKLKAPSVITADIIVRVDTTVDSQITYYVYQQLNTEYNPLMGTFSITDSRYTELTDYQKERENILNIAEYLGGSYWLEQELALSGVLYIQTPSGATYVIKPQNNGFFYSFTGKYAVDSKVDVTVYTYTTDLTKAIYVILLEDLDLLRHTNRYNKFIETNRSSRVEKRD